MRKVTRIDVVHFARLQAVLFVLVGFLFGILYSFGGAIYDLYSSGTVNSGTGLAFLALIGMPIIFSAFGNILG